MAGPRDDAGRRRCVRRGHTGRRAAARRDKSAGQDGGREDCDLNHVSPAGVQLPDTTYDDASGCGVAA